MRHACVYAGARTCRRESVLCDYRVRRRFYDQGSACRHIPDQGLASDPGGERAKCDSSCERHNLVGIQLRGEIAMLLPWYRHVMMLAVCAGVMAAQAVAAEVVSPPAVSRVEVVLASQYKSQVA